MSAFSMTTSGQEEMIFSINDDCIQVQAIYTVAIPAQQDVCGVVGRVTGKGRDVDAASIDDIVIALGPLKHRFTLKADNCQRVTDIDLIDEKMAFWPFAITLIPAINLTEIEIGEQVLVLSNGLVGQMAADLVLLAGAGSCVVVDPTDAVASNPETLPGIRYVKEMSDLDAILPDQSVDLLIDASGNSNNFQSNFGRVHNMGRMLTIGRYSQPRFDFNIYPDLHKRSLKFLNYRLPSTFGEFAPVIGQYLGQPSRSLEFVHYLFKTERLRPATWSVVRLKSPTEDALNHALQNVKQGALLIEW